MAGGRGEARKGASDGPADTVRVVAAVPTRVTIDVVRPYRGPEASAYLRLLSRYPTFDNIHLAVNCRRAGRRIIDTSAVVGAQPGDDLRPLPAGDFVWTLKLQFAPGARANEAPLPGIPDRQAHCLVELATRSILGT